MVGLSLGEKHFIQGGIAQDLRCDGRKRLTHRPIYVETGVIPQVDFYVDAFWSHKVSCTLIFGIFLAHLMKILPILTSSSCGGGLLAGKWFS